MCPLNPCCCRDIHKDNQVSGGAVLQKKLILTVISAHIWCFVVAFCIIDARYVYFLFQLCILHDLVFLLIQVLLILSCDEDQVSLRLACHPSRV